MRLPLRQGWRTQRLGCSCPTQPAGVARGAVDAAAGVAGCRDAKRFSPGCSAPLLSGVAEPVTLLLGLAASFSVRIYCSSRGAGAAVRCQVPLAGAGNSSVASGCVLQGLHPGIESRPDGAFLPRAPACRRRLLAGAAACRGWQAAWVRAGNEAAAARRCWLHGIASRLRRC